VGDSGDLRGSSFSIPAEWSRFLPSAIDLHITSLKPGRIRGNHYHKTRKEVIAVLHFDGWTLYWDEGQGGDGHRQEFRGRGAVMLTVEAGATHAIVNSGARDLFTVGLTDGPFDPADTVKKEIASRSRA
jgi:dTDP-4-dehydrorhamnose 3,5-epimerase-like enzyme